MRRNPSDDCPSPLPLGALRILSRRDGAEVLILHGDDRLPGPGERLALVETFDTIAVASAVSHFCSARLMTIEMYAPDIDGWHPFPARSLGTLVADAKTNLNVTYFPPAPKPAPLYQAWTKQRVARLAFLAGQGWTAKAIADDPLIRSTAHAVYRAARRHDISLSEIASGHLALRLPAETLAYFERAAGRERVTRDSLIRRVLISVATTRVAEPA